MVDSLSREALESAVSYVLALLIVVAAVGLVYLSLTTGMPNEPYTEFYLLGPDGEAADYPRNLSTGERGRVIVGIVNHEHEAVTYSVELRFGGAELETRTAALEPGETRERPFTFSAPESGVKRLEVLLYSDSNTASATPYRSLHMTVRVENDSSDATPNGSATPTRIRWRYR